MASHDKKGRSKKDAKHARLYLAMRNTEAWSGMKPGPRVLYQELQFKYNGENNGEVFLSLRDAAKALNMDKGTAKAYYDTLIERGFIKPNVHGSFDWKQGKATTWIITEYPFEGSAPTRDYLKWRELEKKSRYGKSRQPVRKIQTVAPPEHAGAT